MKTTFVARVANVPGLVARVDAVFRRQSAVVRRLELAADGGEAAPATLTVVADTPPESVTFLVRQMRRLADVREVLSPDVPLIHPRPKGV